MTAFDYVTQSALRERGWTDGLIRDLLGEPDKTTANPHYRRAAPCKLYVLSRVELAEQTETFVRKQVRLASMRARARARADAARASEVEWAETVEIKVKKCNFAHLEQEAMSASDDGNFGLGWVVAVARHQRTNYDELAERVRACNREAYLVLVRRVALAVAEAWPELAHSALIWERRKCRDHEMAAALEGVS